MGKSGRLHTIVGTRKKVGDMGRDELKDLDQQSWGKAEHEAYNDGKRDYNEGRPIAPKIFAAFGVRRAYMIGVAVACQWERLLKQEAEENKGVFK
jgi:hypothetical protein